MLSSPQHSTPFVDARVDNQEIVVFGEEMFVAGEVHATFLRGGAKFVAILDKAAVL